MAFLKKIPWPDFFLLAFLLLFFGFLLAEKIDLTTLDLGRYLKNGELFWTQEVIPQTNLYSYTWPDFPFLNHHWLAGPIFFLIQRVGGFDGLSVFALLAGLSTFVLFFSLAKQEGGLALAFGASLLAIPLLVSRRDIRPELFSYFFVALVFWILWQFRAGRLSRRWLFLLPLIESAWVNLHVYFFLGFFLIGLFWLEGRRGRHLLFLVLILSFLAAMVNPAGLEGTLYPLRVYENYGYRVFEEQPVWFIERLFNYPPALYFKIVFTALVSSFLFSVLGARPRTGMAAWLRSNFLSLALGVSFSLAGWLMIRNWSLFGYFALFLISLNLGQALPREVASIEEKFLRPGLVSLFALVSLLFSPFFWPADPGLGLKKNVERAAIFFQQENLAGPIFNNYDIGGYLIYYLFPREKVFVDNRPAAYPVSFFENFYIRLQDDESFWAKAGELFKFNVIFFYRRDVTPWAQKFLTSRVRDEQWAPVFVDDETIIFLKRNARNERVIGRFEIPRNYFKVGE